MIELLGYITLYVLVGVVLLPVWMLMDSMEDVIVPKRIRLLKYIIFWPAQLFFASILGWIEFKEYK